MESETKSLNITENVRVTADVVRGVPGMAHISEVEMYLQPRAVTPKA